MTRKLTHNLTLSIGTLTLKLTGTTLVEDVEPKPEPDKPRKDKATEAEIMEFCRAEGLPESDAKAIWLKWQGSGWTNGGNPIKDWRATIRSWKAQGFMPSQKNAAKTLTVGSVRSAAEAYGNGA